MNTTHGDTPLTPERLEEARRPFMRRCILTLGGALWAGMVLAAATGEFGRQPPTVRGVVLFALLILVPCWLAGYLFALVMWQREKAFLETAEYERKKRSWPKAPTASGESDRAHP